ncbi:MAG TPA: SLBB domain-containing protein [Acidobacteriaceae bacterium]|nr:SLBB domain-containing protein [Acidobacteriaceae bacterium]
MGKRSAFFLAALLAASLVSVKLPVVAAQVLGGASSDSSSCSSGLFSPVDGSCIGIDSSSGMGGLGSGQNGYGLGEPGNGGLNQGMDSGMGSGGGYPGLSGAGGSDLSLQQLGQQYPGLGSYGNAGASSSGAQTGLTISRAQQLALAQERDLSLLNNSPPTEFQRMVRNSVGQMLPIYGDTLFRVVPSTFAPLLQTPVPPNYVLGPGDQLVIHIWGQINFNSQVTVDRTGSIYLPEVGGVHVAGIPYSDLQQHLSDALSRIYKNFNLEVELGQLRAIQILVVGQARRPGTFTLSSLSTLVDAIFATGGPSVQGTLRDIQLKRNGQTITHFDLYDLLIRGDKSNDVPLLTGDVIDIPPVGPQVALTGSVRNPAIYELKGNTSLGQALAFAGGLSPTASLKRASLERIDAHQNRTMVNVSLEGAGLETELEQGDILHVLPISPQIQNSVTLRGNVAEPGRFAWHPGMKLSEIIPDSQSLITRDYWERRNQLGIPAPEFKPEYASNPDLFPRVPENGGPVPVVPATNASGNTAAGSSSTPTTVTTAVPGGVVPGTVLNQTNTQNTTPANAAGNSALSAGIETTTPGSNPPRPPLNVTLPVPEIDWSYAVIERMDPQTLTTSLVPFNPGKLVLDHDPSQDLELEPGDVVTIFSQMDIRVPQAQRTKYVRLEGEFKQAGIYSVRPGETLRELVARAGGLTPDAYLFGSDFTRESTRVIQQQRMDDYVQQLELEIDRATVSSAAGAINPQDAAASAGEASAAQALVARFRTLRASGRIVLNLPANAQSLDEIPNIQLEDGDSFVVPSRPGTVSVVGAVYNENSFLYKPAQLVNGYLRLAGGANKNADDKQAFIIRADGSVVSRQSQHGVFGSTFDVTRLNPGDTIVIPEKVPKATALRNINNLSQIFSELALGAASIAVVR